MRKQAMWVCRLINRAFMEKESKLDIVKGLVAAINDLKLQIQLAKELQVFRNFAEFERLSTLAVQSGKQSGGWFVQQGTLKGGLKRRSIHTLFIKPGVELCPS